MKKEFDDQGEYMSNLCYFDYAATTPVCPEVVTAVTEALTAFGNPSSRYPYGKQAADGVKAHRETVAKALSCSPAEVVFTSCGTEGDNWAIRKGVELARRRGRHIITTAIEHSAVLETCRDLEKQGYEVTCLQPDKTGHISLDDFRAALRPDTALVSMMLVNNEVGTILPVADCVRAAKAMDKNIIFHCDAVQGFLKVPFTMASLGADLVTVSGHKLGAPKGIGALYVKKGIRLQPMLTGGGQEEGLRSGTEPTAQIAAFAAACKAAKAHLPEFDSHVRELKEYALNRLQEQVPGLVVVSPGDAPHICAISLPGYPSQMVMTDLDGRGICVSNGSACHKGKPSHVFAAMDLPSDVLKGVLRISFSHTSTREEVDALADALSQIAKERMTIMKG